MEMLRMRDMMEHKQDEINVLKNQLEQKDAAMDVLRNNYELQASIMSQSLLKTFVFYAIDDVQQTVIIGMQFALYRADKPWETFLACCRLWNTWMAA